MDTAQKTPRARKNPPAQRLFAALLIILSPAAAAAQAEMTADDVVANALSRPALDDRLEAQIAVARAEIDEATAVPTPRLSLTLDQVFGDVNIGSLDFSAVVEQQFDLMGWRDTLHSTLPHRESALQSETDAWRLEVASAVQMAFYAVRYHEERLATLRAWNLRLEEGLDAIEAREAHGDASVYQMRRIERELELASARQASALSAVAEAWSQLERWSSWESRPLLVGELPPESNSVEAAPLRPELARLEHLERALDSEIEAWDSPFWRDWAVGVGYRYAEVGPSTGHGFIAMLSVPLTFWNTGAPRMERLRAQITEVRSELRLRTTLADRGIETARERLDATFVALADMPDPQHDADLSRLARLAFDAGEASLIELLDAFESETDLQLARVDLQWEARRAAIALDRRRGLGVPQ